MKKFKTFQDKKINLICVSIQYLHVHCTEILSEQSMFSFSHYQDFEFNLRIKSENGAFEHFSLNTFITATKLCL